MESYSTAATGAYFAARALRQSCNDLRCEAFEGVFAVLIRPMMEDGKQKALRL